MIHYCALQDKALKRHPPWDDARPFVVIDQFYPHGIAHNARA